MFLFLLLFFSMLLLCSFFRLKELFQVKMPKIWVGQTTDAYRRKKKRMASRRKAVDVINGIGKNK